MKLVSGVTVFLVVLGVACGGGTTGAGPIGGSAPATNLGAFADDFCGLIEPCCAADGLSTSGVSCHAFITLLAGQGTYDATQGQACITAIQQESTSPTFCSSDINMSIPSCSAALGNQSGGGQVQPGQPCNASTDCAPPSTPGGSAACLTTCIQLETGNAGDTPCVGNMTATGTSYGLSGTAPQLAYLCSIPNGSACDTTTNTCVPLKAVGQPCTSDEECVAGAYCPFTAATSQCAARLADGQPCTANDMCQTTSFCDTTAGTCKALSPIGAACTSGLTCVGGTCSNGKCTSGLSLICGT
jgi:hypothetical protein